MDFNTSNDGYDAIIASCMAYRVVAAAPNPARRRRAKATCGTIPLKLLKIGALVRVSVRRVKVAIPSACPAAQVWGLAASGLIAAARSPRA
jgi:Transposase DDE domain group 1